jgi:hypothetical protein
MVSDVLPADWGRKGVRKVPFADAAGIQKVNPAGAK